ncbi:hypothetical protein [Sodaliphilus sp.]|uniref:hypothetical protein n=1 Tax=Sodaliphilus sp. TaxID=2815818 RepID=UPI00388F4417
MKKILLLISLFLGITLISCNNKGANSKNNKSEEELDTIWNDRVQETFFDVTFGDSINDVIAKLEKHGFYYKKSNSTDVLLHFSSKEKRFFSFGNMNWEMLDIFASNGRFDGIRFMNASDDKASALNNYNNIKIAIENKYSLTEVTLNDTTIYASSMVFGKNQTVAEVSCYRYETISGNIKIGTDLTYYSLKNFAGPNDEL